MKEIVNVNLTGKGKFGYYLRKEDNTFLGCSEQVSNFVRGSLPCELEIQEVGEKNVVTRVKVVGKTQESATAPIPKQEFKPANEYNDNRQESIVTQMCIKKGADLLMKTDEQITYINLLKYSEMVKRVYDTMIEKKQTNEFPDY